MARDRLLRAMLLASAASVVLSTHVFVKVDLLRFKLVTSPITAVDGRVRVASGDTPGLDRLPSPFALIARVRSSSNATAAFSIAVDGHTACVKSASGGQARRLDCSVAAWNAGTDHVLIIQGPSVPWSLDYLELASHHGNTSGDHYLVVLPASAEQYDRPSLILIAGVWFSLFLILALPPWKPFRRWVDLTFKTIAALVITILAVVQCSNWISSYRIIVSWDTFVRWMVLLLALRIWGAINWFVAADSKTRLGTRHGHLVTVARSGLVALLVLAVYLRVETVRRQDTYGGNYSGFLLVSRRVFDQNPLLRARDDVRRSLVFDEGGGYDGQFMYFAAFDPLLRAFKNNPAIYRRVMDAAPYRFGRIGYSWLTVALSLDRWERYPATMIWLILLSLALTAFILALMAQDHGLTPLVGGLIVVIPGFWPSLQSGLPEPIAAAAFLSGVLCFGRNRFLLAGLLFALSLLIRETGIVAVACLLVGATASGRQRAGAFVALLSGGVLLAWRFYVAWVLYPDWGLDGLFFNPHGLGWPFAGIRDLWLSIAHGQYHSAFPEMARAGIAYPVLLIAGFVMALILAATQRSSTSIAALVYAILAVCLDRMTVWGHVGNAQRATYELFVMLALSCLTIRSLPKTLRRGLVIFWACSAAYVFYFAFDAAYIRSALAFPI